MGRADSAAVSGRGRTNQSLRGRQRSDAPAGRRQVREQDLKASGAQYG